MLRPQATAISKLFVFYLIWVGAFRFILEAPMIYFMSRSDAEFQEIVDASTNNQVIFIGLACLLFLIFTLKSQLKIFYGFSEAFSLKRIETLFYPSFLKGAVISSIFTLFFLILGYYHYVGFFIQSDASWLATLTLFIKAVAVLSMVFTEEMVFRKEMMTSGTTSTLSPFKIIFLTTSFYLLSKSFQFHLGWSHLITLCLISVSLSIRFLIKKEFESGAGLLTGFLFTSYCLLSIPIFGNDAQGLFMFRYNNSYDLEHPWVRFLTGGAGGLLSSILLQFLLLVHIIYCSIKNKKIILTSTLSN